MKALMIEFFYEKKAILSGIIVTLFIYFLYIPIFSNPEIIVAPLVSYIFASLYGALILKRKNTNFEIFLASTPLGRKTIINTGYIVGLISSFIITTMFSMFYFIREYFIHIKSVVDIELNYNPLMLILNSFGFGLITTGILFPASILQNKENKFLSTLVSFMALFISGIYIIILKLNVLNIRVITLGYLIISICVYIFSYLITTNKYLKKEL
ncbi:ABC-2 transporter permease [uncultured Tyzzerella sp.]|uniref:ABC-2 transporter permease n=1 Tax=uncultured Tyzzerella sp. TaxID=2321398 RepID=UPI002941C17C|nr:ABC-2 transporter permease [uncultured Tyzzerella sp.]